MSSNRFMWLKEPFQTKSNTGIKPSVPEALEGTRYLNYVKGSSASTSGKTTNESTVSEALESTPKKSYLKAFRSLSLPFLLIQILLGCSSNKLNFEKDAIRITSLKCEALVNPLGIQNETPKFSWVLQSDQRGQQQIAYQILVASSEDFLNQDQGDIWDSGTILSNQSIHVKYNGKDLKPRQKYFWKVRVKGVTGSFSDWSEKATWTMGIFENKDWKGQWITSDLELYDFQKELKKIPDHNLETEGDMWARSAAIVEQTKAVTEAPAIWMRKEFDSHEKELKTAVLFISGLGLYEAYMNGEKINDHFFPTTPHDFGKTVPYHAYDVTDKIQQGNNAIGVILGNGYYNPVVPSVLREYSADFINTPRLKCELILTYADNTQEIIPSDTSWKFTTEGPIRFNAIRAGETYDARKTLGHWSAEDYDESNWKSVITGENPTCKLRARNLPPVRVIDTIPAIGVEKIDSGYRIDLGIETTGWARVKVNAKSGQKITIKYPGAPSHTLGRYQTYEYICNGKNEEVYEPRFAFNGFRYVEIYGLDYEPTLNDINGIQVVSEIKAIGEFSCSNNKMNELFQINQRTLRNYYVGMPMDPTREKVCWTQDVQSNFENSAYNFDMNTIYAKWQEDFIDGILPNGYVPAVVPSCFDGPTINGPWWGGMIIYNAWQLFHFYGDTTILAKSYPAMKKYFGYLESIAKENVIEWGLGDWMDIAGGGSGRPRGTTVAFTSTAAFMMYAEILSQIAAILNNSKDGAYFSKRKKEIKTSLNSEFYDHGKGFYDKGSQTSYILALRLDLFEGKQRAQLIENLKKQVVTDKNHLSTGFVGTPFLLTALNEEGLGNLAWQMTTQETYPSWYDMIYNKKNSVFKENWQGGLVQMPSLAGPIGAWFYRGLGGIKPLEAGFKSFEIRPYIGGLDWVKCKYECPYGQIECNWEKKGKELMLKVRVPMNTTAKILIPGSHISEGGTLIEKLENMKEDNTQDEIKVVTVGSGAYHFTSVLP